MFHMVRGKALNHQPERHIMTPEELNMVHHYVSESVLYVPLDGEAINIRYYDEEEEYFSGDGEETGEEYMVYYTEVDLANAMWYKLVRVNL